VKNDNGDWLADTHDNLNIWKVFYLQLLNVHNISDVRQRADDARRLEVAIAKLISFKL
jgi:hypothetical protein